MHGDCVEDSESSRGFKCKCAPGVKGINCDLSTEYSFWNDFHVSWFFVEGLRLPKNTTVDEQTNLCYHLATFEKKLY